MLSEEWVGEKQRKRTALRKEELLAIKMREAKTRTEARRVRSLCVSQTFDWMVCFFMGLGDPYYHGGHMGR